MRLLFILLLAWAMPLHACVFVLHGLARGPASMNRIVEELTAAGFPVTNVAYASRTATFEAMVETLRDAVKAKPDCKETHFVGYSLGALVVRAYLATPPKSLGRVVLIAPPNHGTEIIDAIGGADWFKAMMGPVATQLGTGKNAIPQRLPPPRYPVGVIAGDQSINVVGTALIPGTHDGTVSVQSARLEGMADFLVVHRTHTFIMRAPEVAEATVRFLKSGRFGG
jgi:triacylglycerol lipase